MSMRLFAIGALLVGACSQSATPVGDLGGGDMAVALVVQPSTITLGPAQTQHFSASLPASWSVVEAGGGQVDGDGNYTAPATLGTYHLQARSDDGQQASATITVADRALALLAGALGGPGDADDTGTRARFRSPEQLAYDGNGTVYVADSGNHTVRAVALATGAVTTIAGTPGVAGASDGVGAAARFDEPWGLALDGKGALYVADSDNHTIRRVALATRAVTTVSGTAGTMGYQNGTSALYTVPLGLASDGGTQLFIADSGNGAVRVLDTSTGAARTLATGFSDPVGLAFDGGANLYVSDGAQLRIARVAVADGTVTTLAGGAGYRDGSGATAHFSFLGQLALAGNTLYIADLALRALDLGTGAVTTLTPARDDLAGGGGLALDEQGHLLVTLLLDHALVRVNLDGSNRTPVAGPAALASGYADGSGAAARFDGPRSLASDGKGALFVSDAFNNVVRAVDVAGGAVTTLAGSPWLVDSDGSGAAARFNMPRHVASDGNGTLYVVEPTNDVVRRLVVATGALSTIAGTYHYAGAGDGPGASARLSNPGGACVLGGALYVADTGNDTIRKIDLASGVVSTVAGGVELAGAADATSGADARFDTPRDVACDAAAGALYVADTNNVALRRVDPATGATTTVAGALKSAGDVDATGGSARFTAPSFLALGGGFVYVGEPTTARIRRVRLSDFAVTTLAGPLAGSIAITGLAVDGGGTVYYSDRDALVHSVSAAGSVGVLAGGAATVVDGTGAQAGFDEPSGIAFDGSALVVADPNGAVLRRITLAGAVTTFAGCGAFCTAFAGVGRDAFFSRPWGLASDGAGALFATDITGHTLDRIATADGALAVAAGTPLAYGTDDGSGAAARLDAPSSLAWDGAGAVYLSDRNDSTIKRFVVATGAVTTIAGMAGTNGADDGVGAAARFHGPEGLALDGAGDLYVADAGNHVVRKLVLATLAVSTLAGAAGQAGAVDGVGGAARFNQPLDLAYDGAGSLYVADAGNGAVRRIELATATVTTYAGVLGSRGVAPGPLPARLNRPTGLAWLPDGTLAVADEAGVLVIR